MPENGFRPGRRNLITDVAGLRVGNAEDHVLKSGVTVLLAETPFVAAVDVMGGAPGSRETELLAPDRLVDQVDAIVLAGGSAFGLDAASGVGEALRRQGRGYRVGPAAVPIVPAAIIFDLLNGGDKDWDTNPYRALGERAMAAASADFALGTAGAGTGAFTANLKGGLGSASLQLPSGHTVGALVAANPTGSVTVGDSRHFWAAASELDGEFGAAGLPPGPVPFAQTARTKADGLEPVANTTIAIVATDAILSKAQARRLAVAAQDGIARAVSPAHSAVDGDLVFALSTAARPLPADTRALVQLGHAAAFCLARAIARAVFLASPATGDPSPTWREKWGR